jgi:hypothetical protein
MAKIAYLFGVSEYESWLDPLPAAVKDVAAMESVLRDRNIGEFDDVRAFRNPGYGQIRDAVEALFTNRQVNDLVLLYFSGHGMTDIDGQFYFMARDTEANQQNRFSKAKAIDAPFVHNLMDNCNSRRIVVILDCCHGSAFVKRDGGEINFEKQLGGEGRIVLTASAATRYSFEPQKGEDLAIYTRYLVKGLETGAADLDGDGWVSVNELHDYVVEQLKNADPRMSPRRCLVKGDGEKILLAKAAVDPDREYQKLVKQCCRTGDILPAGREMLDRERNRLAPFGLTAVRAANIELEELEPYRRQRDEDRATYRKTLQKTLALNLTQQVHAFEEIRAWENQLKLSIEDKEKIRLEVLGSKIFPKIEPKPVPSPSPTVQPKPTIIAQPVESSPIPQPKPRTIPLPHSPKSQAISQPVSIPLATRPRVQPIDRSSKLISPKIRRRGFLQNARQTIANSGCIFLIAVFIIGFILTGNVLDQYYDGQNYRAIHLVALFTGVNQAGTEINRDGLWMYHIAKIIHPIIGGFASLMVIAWIGILVDKLRE